MPPSSREALNPRLIFRLTQLHQTDIQNKKLTYLHFASLLGKLFVVHMPIPFSESENWQQFRQRQTCNATVILSEPEWNCIHEQMIFEQTSILRLTESSICDASIESSLPAIFFVKDFFLLRDVFIVTEKNTLSVFFFFLHFPPTCVTEISPPRFSSTSITEEWRAKNNDFFTDRAHPCCMNSQA